MSLFSIIVYPGIIFTLLCSLLLAGILRKLAARMQSRIGPPIIQPFYDTIKLLSKENIRPDQAKHGFSFWPIVAVSSAIIAGLMVPLAGITALEAGDIIVVVYFLALSSIGLYLSGIVSGNPFGFVGAIRGITQMFSYEFPFILSLLFPVFFLETLSVAELNAIQLSGAWTITLFPFAGIVFLISVLAALELPPFHIPNAHQEIVGGYSVEFTGTRLAYIELSHMIKAFVMISLAIAVFLGGAATLGVFAAKALGLLFVLTFMRVLMARLRIDTALKFCWVLGYLLLLDYALRLLM